MGRVGGPRRLRWRKQSNRSSHNGHCREGGEGFLVEGEGGGGSRR